MKKPIIQTNRLVLTEFDLGDTAFIMELTNTEGWLRNIGDRQTRTEGGARAYLEKGPLASYASTGFGLWKLSLKENLIPIGICGIFKREIFDSPDIGYAILPAYEGHGYISEAALACKAFVMEHCHVNNIVGITDIDNIASIRILEKMGMAYRKNITMPGSSTELKFFSLFP